MNQRSHTGWLTDMTECIAMLETSNARFTERIIELEADLAAAQSYATTLAVSMHRQHYAEAAPNWQPVPDLVGLLTQIDNMYAGLRNDFEAAEVENKRLVGANLSTLREELAAAQATELMHLQARQAAEAERDEARAEVAALRVDAERVCFPIGRYVVDHIASEGMLNAAGGIYATSIHDFAYEIQKAFSESNRIAFPDDTAAIDQAIEARKEGA